MAKAIALASAEADLARCEAALREHLEETRDSPVAELLVQDDVLEVFMDPETLAADRMILRLKREIQLERAAREVYERSRTERLLMCYRQEAFSRRKRAFRDWITEMKQPNSST